MKKRFVNSNNATKIAKHLLELEIQHLQENYHMDAESFIYQLQKALENYINPLENKTEMKQWRTIDHIERSLKQLMYHVNEFIHLLTPEAQKKLEQQFNASQPGVHYARYKH